MKNIKIRIVLFEWNVKELDYNVINDRGGDDLFYFFNSPFNYTKIVPQYWDR
jgi:hypothetical protein